MVLKLYLLLLLLFVEEAFLLGHRLLFFDQVLD